MDIRSDLSMKGALGVRVIRAKGPGAAWRLANFPHWFAGWLKLMVAIAAAKISGLPVLYGQLELRLTKASGEVINYGVVSYRVVTTAFVNNLASNMVSVASPTVQAYTYHASGTGVTAEATSDTALGTDSGVAHASGTQSNPTANQYRTVGTQTYSGTLAITEHGVFSASTVGTLLDRSVFSAVNVANGGFVAA